MKKKYNTYKELADAFKSGELDRNKYFLMLDKEEAKQYMYPSSGGKFDTNVKWRTYGFGKIVGLRVNKQEMINTDIGDDQMEVFDFIGHKLRA